MTPEELEKLQNNPEALEELAAKEAAENPQVAPIAPTPAPILEVTAPDAPAPKDDMLKNLRANIQKYQDKMNAPKESNWQDSLPDMLAAAHNIVNYGQGSQQKMIKTDSAAKAKASRAAAKKEGLSQLQNLQKMYQDYMTAEGKGKLTTYQKAQLGESEKDRELKQKLANKKQAKVTSFREKETIKSDLKNQAVIDKENRGVRMEAQKSLKDLDKQIANVKKAAKLMKDSTKSLVSDTGPIDQYISPLGTKGQKLRQTFNEISLDKMTKMFAGMSKAIDSDAERKFFEQSQVSMGSYPEVNMGILKNMLVNLESLKLKNQGTLKSIDKSGKIMEEAPQINEVRRVTKDGRSAIFNADTKEFIRYE